MGIWFVTKPIEPTEPQATPDETPEQEPEEYEEPAEKVSYDIEDIETHNEAGVCAKVTCPECECEVSVGGWSDATCDCGLKWSLEIRAVGTPSRRRR